MKCLLCGEKPALKRPLFFVKGGNIGTLKGIDRLLFITHHEQRAPAGPGTLTRGKFGGEAFDHRPLFGSGVLRLIDQNVVDAAIQPEQNPGGDRRVRQQTAGAGNQIIKIQHPLCRLALGVDRQKCMGEPVDRGSFLGGLQGLATRTGTCKPAHQIVQAGHQVGNLCARGFGREIPDLGLTGPQTGAEQENPLEPCQSVQIG